MATDYAAGYATEGGFLSTSVFLGGVGVERTVLAAVVRGQANQWHF